MISPDDITEVQERLRSMQYELDPTDPVRFELAAAVWHLKNTKKLVQEAHDERQRFEGTNIIPFSRRATKP